MQSYTFSRHVILSGCSGGGKSTLLAELASRGFQAVPEPGRRIVAEEQRGDCDALPWVDLEAFARRAIQMSSEDRERFSNADRWVFFDRGLVDAAVALQHATGIAVSDSLSRTDRFHHQVFLTPPWPEIYETDSERQHQFEVALAEYQRLLEAFEQLDYEIIVLPKIDVKSRADFVLKRLC